MASFGLSLSESELQNLYSAMDSDASGQISLDEFLAYMAEPASKQSVEEIASGVFALIDTDKSGR